MNINIHNVDAQTGQAGPVVGPALVAGFGATLAAWIAWWLTHLPGAGVAAPVAAAAIGLAFAGGLLWWTRLSPSPVRTGLLGGALGGGLNLLILGSVLSVQAEDASEMAEYANRFRDEAWTILFAFAGITVSLGAVCGVLGRLVAAAERSTDAGRWLSRLSVVTVVSFFPLLLVGGAVTGTESGMAVPDAVTSYGAFSALLPISMMAEPRIFLEHTHRLFGTLVGLTTIALFLYSLVVERRVLPRVLAGVLLGLVIGQGVLGALRVGAESSHLAAVHGVIAQIVLGFATLVACRLSVLDREGPIAVEAATAEAARRAAGISHAAAGALLVQLVLGALARHSTGSSHAVWTHAGFSIVVVSLVVIGAAMLRTAEAGSSPGRVLRRIGLALTVTVFAQFVLGFLALWQVGMGSASAREIPTAETLATAEQIDVLEAAVTTAHQTLGAGLLVLVTLAVFWSKRLRARPA